MSNKYFVQCVEEYTGFMDYWSGHGHAFEKEAIGCIQISIPIDYTETNEEIYDNIKTELNGSEWFDITDNESLDIDLANNALDGFLDENIRLDKTHKNARYWSETQEEFKPESDMDEPPYYLIIFHAFKDDSN